MSRIGNSPVAIPAGVRVELKHRKVCVEGPKGSLSWEHHGLVAVTVKDGRITVERSGQGKLARALHGTTRQLIHNMVRGVSHGFEKSLRLVGVGYNAKLKEKKLVLQIGFCHPVEFDIPDGIEVELPKPILIVVRGTDKQQVGQFAAIVRRVRPPEPYKGKGIMYFDEVIRRKATKSFGSA